MSRDAVTQYRDIAQPMPECLIPFVPFDMLHRCLRFLGLPRAIPAAPECGELGGMRGAVGFLARQDVRPVFVIIRPALCTSPLGDLGWFVHLLPPRPAFAPHRLAATRRIVVIGIAFDPLWVGGGLHRCDMALLALGQEASGGLCAAVEIFGGERQHAATRDARPGIAVLPSSRHALIYTLGTNSMRHYVDRPSADS